MESLPVEILSVEIGKYLDLSGLICMSLVNKSMMEIFHYNIQVVIQKIDPYSDSGTVFDLLSMIKIGTIKNMRFKIWQNLFHETINQINHVYPYLQRQKIIDTFVQVVPKDAVEDIKNKITHYIYHHSGFFIFRDVVYRNKLLIKHNKEISNFLETELIDIVDPLLHELSESSEPKTEDTSDDSAQDSEMMEYFPYDDILDSLEKTVQYL
jgi:hypothetical protein